MSAKKNLMSTVWLQNAGICMEHHQWYLEVIDHA